MPEGSEMIPFLIHIANQINLPITLRKSCPPQTANLLFALVILSNELTISFRS